MMKEHIVANPAPRRRQRVLFDAAASLSIAFCLIFAACDSNPTSESFDSVANGHVITFNKNGGDGDAPNTIVVMHEGVLRLPGNGNLTKNGYTFGGWSSTPSNSGNLYSAGETYRAYGDIILYARWNAPAYTITFNANGGTVSPTSAATNSSGYLNIDLPTPTRSGYTFDGWYTSSSGGTRVTTGYAFTGNTTIYAQWTTTSPGTSYTITLNANGGTLAGGSTVTTGTNGKLSSIPSYPTRSGYTFNGWYTSDIGGTMITTDYTFTSNTTIYAQWTTTSPGTSYTITLNANGGTLAGGSTVTTGTNGKLSSLPSNPTRSGYSFNGWYTSATDGTRITTDYTFTSNSTIYAQWTSSTPSATYTITLNANGGTLTGGSTVTTGTNGKLSSIPSYPTRSGYTFNGWYTSATDGTRITTDYTFTSNSTIYAQWTSSTPSATYTITLSANGGTLADGSTVTTGTNGKLSSLPSNPTRSGYTFNGWYTSATGGSMITTDHTFTSNSTIYAQWTSAITYTITFNANGGSVSPTSGTTNTNGNLTSLPTPARGGYTFNGWYSSATGGSRITTDYQFTGNTTVYAQWAQIIITFSPNGGTVDRTSAPVGEDGTLADLPTPTRLGYTFIGWTDPNGEEVSLTTVFLASVTIRAQWEQNSYYTITFDANGGIFYLPDGPTSTDPRNTGDTFKLPGSPTIPVWPGYTFAGWYDAPTDGNRIMAENYETQVYPRSMTVYAHWTPIEEDVEE